MKFQSLDTQISLNVCITLNTLCHIWQASFCNVKSGTWCPFCYRYKHEQLCQEIVAKYLGPPSENCRPDFLKIPEHSKGLELDIPYLL
ncbi:hypothetical protein RhiirA5_432451 [Rhizophagus irregularis]|uniref:Uncharacterized protein n=1 Tax=Rhizophagus irregularis TaxID=588596 RepID=A0A2N0QXG2_9GLOM|nr:hypothetical protein RhiirA5_432451 [Rhizophagus irregularis]PKC55747.1 hypothetical protein RhiirA1_475084 [Rhizophagus irregularis]